MNSNSQNYGNIVIYDKVNHCCRLQIFTEGGDYLKVAKFKEIATIRALTTTMDDLIITVDAEKEIFIISDTLVIINRINCHKFLTNPFYIAAKGNLLNNTMLNLSKNQFIKMFFLITDDEIFITDWKKHKISVINRKGQFLGYIGFEKQTFCPRGICFVGDKIIFSHIDRFNNVVNFYEYSRNGRCYLKYVLKNIKVCIL